MFKKHVIFIISTYTMQQENPFEKNYWKHNDIMSKDICLCLHSSQCNVKNVKERMQSENCVSFSFAFIAWHKEMKKHCASCVVSI